VTVDLVNSGIGLQGYTVASATNANVTIPPFPFGTTAPVTATFTRPNPSQPVDFTLRASARSSAVMIHAQCSAPATGPEQEAAFRLIVSDFSFWLPEQSARAVGEMLSAMLYADDKRERH
jgi:hypothetical protein